jgi:hypothetical protein
MIDDLALKDDLEEEIEEPVEADEPAAAEEAEVEEVTDNVGDPSVEINVEELIHELETHGLANKLCKEQQTRKRLEELMERRRANRDLEDFDDYKI